MRHPRVDDYVRVTNDIPELALSRGEIGIVRNAWFGPAPTTAYEVGFHKIGRDGELLARLIPEQVSLVEGSLFADVHA
jgi:hypothetical protein